MVRHGTGQMDRTQSLQNGMQMSLNFNLEAIEKPFQHFKQETEWLDLKCEKTARIALQRIS